MIRRASIGFLFAIVVYVGSYALNSWLGGYWMYPVADGQHRYSSGLSIPSAILWQPRFGYASLHKKDALGYFFLPLIAVDRKMVHPTRSIFDPQDYAWLGSEQAKRLRHSKTP